MRDVKPLSDEEMAERLVRDGLAKPLPSYTHIEFRRHTLRTLLATLDALRAKLADAERERDAERNRREAAEVALKSLRDVLWRRHAGRMPDEVEKAVQAATDHIDEHGLNRAAYLAATGGERDGGEA